jgi:hypothetical protein
MIRRLLIPLLGSGLLLVASAGSALAKCDPNADPMPAFCSEMIVSLNIVGGGTLLAGTRESVDIDVSQGEQPYPAMDVWLTFTDQDGTRVRVPATAAGAGRWTAEVLLPNVGSWSVVAQVVDLNGGEYRIPVNTVWGTSLPALPPAETPVTAPQVTPAAPIQPIALLLGGLAAAAGAGYVLGDRSRRRTTGAATGASAAARDSA